MVITDPSQRHERLADLHVDERRLVEAIRRGEAARNNATQHHPPTFGGYSAYAETTRALRDLFVPDGASKDDSKNFCRLICPGGHDAIAVTSGDEFTGDPDHNPQPKYDRGIAAQDAVEMSQISFWPDPRVERVGPRIWFLLIRRFGSIAKAELSRPEGISESGFVTNWETRIILPDVPVEPVPDEANRPDYSPPVDFDISPN